MLGSLDKLKLTTAKFSDHSSLRERRDQSREIILQEMLHELQLA